MSISAIGPWPCPRLIMCRRSPGVQPCFSANRCSIAVGSAPVDRMNTTGVWLDVSGNTSSSVHGAGSVNSAPSFSATYRLQPNSSFSSQKILTTTRRARLPDSFASHRPGSGAACGSGQPAHDAHASDAASRSAGRPASSGMSDSADSSTRHAASLTQPHDGGRARAPPAAAAPPTGPRTRKFHSASEIFPLEVCRSTEVHRRKLYRSLCSSNSPRDTLLKMNAVRKSDSSKRRVGTSSAFPERSMQWLKRRVK
eukprot:361799-Chlamydomonas_euryale.AAC.1